MRDDEIRAAAGRLVRLQNGRLRGERLEDVYPMPVHSYDPMIRDAAEVAAAYLGLTADSGPIMEDEVKAATDRLRWYESKRNWHDAGFGPGDHYNAIRDRETVARAYLAEHPPTGDDPDDFGTAGDDPDDEPDDNCPRCGGTGDDPNEEESPCPSCEGEGYIED